MNNYFFTSIGLENMDIGIILTILASIILILLILNIVNMCLISKLKKKYKKFPGLGNFLYSHHLINIRDNSLQSIIQI